jgi:hypothetical protein
MINASRRLLIGFALSLLIACSSGEGKYARAFASPDGTYVAVLISDIGGGFPSASCTNTVVVVRREAVPSGIYPASSRAYVGDCHTLKMTYENGHAILPNAPKLRWTGPRSLSIEFNPNLARRGTVPFYSAAYLYDGRIAIHNDPQ